MEKTTRDHAEIQRWAEKLGGKPAIIDHPIARADKRGIRIEFPGESREVLMSETQPASWDEFFTIFEEQGLLITYEDDPQGGDPADWYHYEKRQAEDEGVDET
jgi:uncharacterized lipoprotein